MSYQGVTALVVARDNSGDIVFEENVKFAALPRAGESVELPSAGLYQVKRVVWNTHRQSRQGKVFFVANNVTVELR